MKKILIMRHANADWPVDNGSDFDRALNETGKQDVSCVAAWLKGKSIIPDCVISSPALRAKETTELLSDEMAFPKKLIHWQQILYGAGLRECLEIIKNYIDQADTLLLVSHNPTLDELVSYLSSEPPPRTLTGELMTTSAIAVFSVADEVLPNHLKLEYVIRPKEI